MARMALIILALLVLAACQRDGSVHTAGAMPMNAENIERYISSVVEVQGAGGAKPAPWPERGTPEFFDMYRKTFVAPMNKMGFNYDNTILAGALTVVEGRTPEDDMRLSVAITALLYMPIELRKELVSEGIISPETAGVLDAVQLDMPH